AGAQVLVTFNYTAATLMIGEDGTTVDTFDDATPNYASSVINFGKGAQAGDYTIDKVYLWDAAGHNAAYSAGDLAALGLPSKFTVINNNAPATPIEMVAMDANHLI